MHVRNNVVTMILLRKQLNCERSLMPCSNHGRGLLTSLEELMYLLHATLAPRLSRTCIKRQGGPENPKAKRHRANHFFLHVGNSTVSSSLRRNLDVFPVAVDQSLHWSSCASVDRLIPSKHPLVDHFMHMANGAMPTSKATENDWCVSAI